ncbi:MAG TPA: prenyltransferase/squalene oxidase repeat-containing protein [Candidatus Nanoarchaeia archaeon]|nr:prenyltransferase/squalene oxidase repeat-containing protein [Candidatus Nanoarchaeia archaeon]
MEIKTTSVALEKARIFLEKSQSPNGSWSVTGTFSHKEPPYYLKEIVLTPEAISALVLINSNKSLNAVSKALNFCLKHVLTDRDHLDMWAWRAVALSLSNAKICKEELAQAVAFLEKQQAAEGYWPSFPSTYNLTNFSVLYSIRKTAKEPALKKARAWLMKNKARDRNGWGFNHESQESEVSYTGNVIKALILAGEDALSNELQEARVFLESKQLADGGWPSSKTTIADKSTTYGTAFATISLMLLSENPFNKNIEKGIKFLLEAQSEDGGWPLVKGEKGEFYTTYYTTYALALYRYLKENLDNPKFAYLKEKLKPQQLSQFLLQNFEDQKYNWLSTATEKSAITERMLGSTFDAVMRRKDILKVLSHKGELTIAGIIDLLKEDAKYEHLNKRSHITLVKNDLDYLKALNLVTELDSRYFASIDLLSPQ